MHFYYRPYILCLLAVFFCLALATPGLAIDPINSTTEKPVEVTTSLVLYKWNLSDAQRPLLSLADQVKPDIDLSLSYPLDQFAFPLLQSLNYNQRSGSYTLQLLPRSGSRARLVELRPATSSGNESAYTSTDGSHLQLVDNKGLKTIRSNDGTEYTFVRFTDGKDKCVRIKARGGATISLVYTRDNLIHALIDSSGRTLLFNYADHRLSSVTQNWTVNSVAMSKSWVVGTNKIGNDPVQFAHANYVRPVVITSPKSVPRNAIAQKYTDEMARSDRLLAGIFGGPGAVAAANGFEPKALADQYPLYRGDFTADDGRVMRGHLSFAMHLYGNANGTGDSALYVPAGFTSHSNVPSPTDAVITFYYPRLGNLTNVTLAVFHVANFQIVSEGARVRIGNIGGPGGDTLRYKHSHIEFYLGNTGLPSSNARPSLRIDPATVFGTGSPVAANHQRTAPRSSF